MGDVMGFKAHAFFLFLFFMLDHGTTNMGAWHGARISDLA
jgi:hypothetical protein